MNLSIIYIKKTQTINPNPKSIPKPYVDGISTNISITPGVLRKVS